MFLGFFLELLLRSGYSREHEPEGRENLKTRESGQRITINNGDMTIYNKVFLLIGGTRLITDVVVRHFLD